MTVPEKLETRTQKIVRVTSEVAVAGSKKVWRNLLLLVFAVIFGGIGVAYFLSAGTLGRLSVCGIGAVVLLVLWFLNRPYKDQTLHWTSSRGYFKNSDREE